MASVQNISTVTKVLIQWKKPKNFSCFFLACNNINKCSFIDGRFAITSDFYLRYEVQRRLWQPLNQKYNNSFWSRQFLLSHPIGGTTDLKFRVLVARSPFFLIEKVVLSSGQALLPWEVLSSSSVLTCPNWPPLTSVSGKLYGTFLSGWMIRFLTASIRSGSSWSRPFRVSSMSPFHGSIFKTDFLKILVNRFIRCLSIFVAHLPKVPGIRNLRNVLIGTWISHCRTF